MKITIKFILLIAAIFFLSNCRPDPIFETEVVWFIQNGSTSSIEIRSQLPAESEAELNIISRGSEIELHSEVLMMSADDVLLETKEMIFETLEFTNEEGVTASIDPTDITDWSRYAHGLDDDRVTFRFRINDIHFE